MTINFNASGDTRKKLTNAVSEIIGAPAEYQFMPTCAYIIGKWYTVTKEGNLEINDRADSKEVEHLLEELPSHGFEFPEEPDTLTVQMPRDFFTDSALDNLKHLIENKGNLIKHALLTDSLEITETEEMVEFPWFTIEHDNDAEAYIRFITKLCDFAKNQKRVNNKPDMATNEKYAFRCFLIRIGMVGNEFKVARKVLLRNLTGSSAFRDGRPNGGNEDEVSE